MTREALIELLRRQGIRSPEVLEALAAVPRERFVPEHLRSTAWRNVALPIGDGQTISQPWIVARMTELAHLAPGDRVLEVGTGSGYQTAVLGRFDIDLYTVERLEEHALLARERLDELGVSARFRIGDGWEGWPEAAPFDRIVVTAAPERAPPALLEQLAEGGILVLPVGPEGGQVLSTFTRRGERFEREDILPVSFVPLVRGLEERAGRR